MAFAPHSNTDVLLARKAGEAELPELHGSFRSRETDVLFEFGARGQAHGDYLPDVDTIIYVGNGETRLARVYKTVAYIVVDEGEDGLPVVQKWQIKQRRDYAPVC